MLTPLAKARSQRGISLTVLSKAVEYDRGGLSRIERGVTKPRTALANRLVEFFEVEGITRDQIMFPEDYMGQPSKRPPTSAPRKKPRQLQEAS
ncbi:MAG TPA: helix-turn-helix transcriptional regulator [Acidobacteriaceae bacterium]|nr:helix-turn-helix transcriptional regulator [Acidobacteriaceae bacterium]